VLVVLVAVPPALLTRVSVARRSRRLLRRRVRRGGRDSRRCRSGRGGRGARRLSSRRRRRSRSRSRSRRLRRGCGRFRRATGPGRLRDRLAHGGAGRTALTTSGWTRRRAARAATRRLRRARRAPRRGRPHERLHRDDLSGHGDGSGSTVRLEGRPPQVAGPDPGSYERRDSQRVSRDAHARKYAVRA
jgi:hypothetical protein